jgi:integrase
VGPLKTEQSKRVIALPSLALHLLEQLPKDSLYLFWQQQPPSPKQLSDLMHRLCQRAAVPRQPPRRLRNTHISLLVATGVDPKSLQKRAGHSDISTTLSFYAYSLPGADRKAAETVDEALGA